MNTDIFGPVGSATLSRWLMVDTKEWLAEGAWFGDRSIKGRVLAKLRDHRERDELIRGTYQTSSNTPSGFSGCALGCMLPNRYRYTPTGLSDGYLPSAPRDEVGEILSFHEEVELRFGIDKYVAGMIDDLFESQDGFAKAAIFAVDSVEAIPVGADLSGVQAWYDAQVHDGQTIQERTDFFFQALENAPRLGAS